MKNSDLRFIVREPSDGHAILVNFTSEELAAAGGAGAGTISESFIILPEIDFFSGCDSRLCGDNQTAAVSSELNSKLAFVKNLKEPVLIVNPFLSDDWKKGFDSLGANTDDVLLFTDFHEAFHNFQNPIFFYDLGKPQFPDQGSCTTDDKQKNIFKTALGQWNDFLVRSQQMSLGQTRDSVKGILEFYKANESVCLDSTRYRQEGTANYFAFQIISSSKVISTERLIALVNATWLNEKYPALDPDTDYGIGFAMYRALSILDPSMDWQKKINQNQDPLITLNGLLGI